MAEPAILDRVRRALGDAAVSVAGESDRDPRTQEPVSGRSFGAPIAWVRATSTEECAKVLRLAHEERVPVAVVGEATTFWDGLRVEGAIALDATRLRGPLHIDVERRIAWAGAARSVREIDVAARAHGLALAAYPDTGGDTPIGSLVAVGCTAGLGMGRGLPIEQLTGATVVTGAGEVVRLGASHALGHAAFTRHGLPDALGLFVAAEGAAAVITEVGLTLVPAGYVVVGRAAGQGSELPLERMHAALVVARGGLDRGVLDTLRFEAGCKARMPQISWEAFLRVLSFRSPEDALAEARDLASELEAAIGGKILLEPESAEARRGKGKDYDRRYSVPPGEHRRQLRSGAFWGAEVAVGWGSELRACSERLAALFRDAASVEPLHRRFGVYAGHHVVSVGVQVLGRRDPDAVNALEQAIATCLPNLLDLGGVPYRTGNLWRAALKERESAGSALDLVERLRVVIDPRTSLPGAAGRP
jgi:hypothetical protein